MTNIKQDHKPTILKYKEDMVGQKCKHKETASN